MARIPSELQQFKAALAKLEPEALDAFLKSVNDIKSTAQMAVLVDALNRGDINAAMVALNVSPEFWAPLDDTIRAAYLLGGRNAIAALPVIPDPAGLGK